MLETNKVYLMDCFEGLNQLKDNSIDLIVTDPPYFIENLKKNFKEDTIRLSSKNNIFHAEWDQQWDSLETYKIWVEKVLIEFLRVLREKGQVYMFMSYHHLAWIIALIKKIGFRFYKPLIWYKPDTMGVFPNQYGCNYEIILWFRKKGESGSVIFNIGCSQRDVFTFYSTNQKYRFVCGFHPTCKPLTLIKRLVFNGSNRGDLVLDSFMGSGTTAVACKMGGRSFIGFEINENYLKTIDYRLNKTYPEKSLRDFLKV